MELWVGFAILAAAAQTMRFAVQKVLAGGALSPAAATWARFLWSWPLAGVLVWLYARATGAELPAISKEFLAYGLSGGLFQILATICTVSLFRQRAFAVGITFKKTEVLLTAMAGYVILADRIPASGWAAIVAGFLGVVLLSEPPGGGRILNRSAGIGLLSGIFFALAAVTYRGAVLALGVADPILASGMTLAVVAFWQTAALGLWLWWREPGQIASTLSAWRRTGIVSLFSLVGSWSWFAAFSMMNAAYVFAVGQVELVFSLAVGALWFRETIRLRELSGMAILTASIIAVVLLA